MGLLVAAMVLGLAYWVYMKKSKYVTLEHHAGSDSVFNCLVVLLSYIKWEKSRGLQTSRYAIDDILVFNCIRKICNHDFNFLFR